MTDWPAYWWESITGPRNLIEKINNSLQEKKNVALMVPEDLPWRDEMRAAVLQLFRNSPELANVDVDYIDVHDECPEAEDIGMYLLHRYALFSVATNYRGRESIQQYISQNSVLNNRVLWVKGMSQEAEQKWINFCKDYSISKDIEGHFVLEVCHSKEVEEQQNIDYIRYTDYITEYDVLIFNSIYVARDGRWINQNWQQYIASLCSNMCGRDPEISLEMLESTDFRTKDPVEKIQEIGEMREYSRRGRNNKDHILYLARKKIIQEIERKIWKAQLQTVFPLFEMERITFIEKYYDQVSEALKTSYYDTNYDKPRRIHQFGNTLDNPRDAEIGTIYRMTKLRRYENDHFLLYISDESTRERVSLLHDLRNSLAHCQACPVDKLYDFILSFPYKWL